MDKHKLLHENLIDAKQAFNENMKANCILKLYLAIQHCDDLSTIAKIHKIKAMIRNKNYKLAEEMLSDVIRGVNIERKRKKTQDAKTSG